MIRKKYFLLFFIISSVCSNSSFAQNNNKALTLEDIYEKRMYGSKGFGPVRWMKDNKGYSTLENNAEVKGNDIVVYDVSSGTKKVLVSAKQLIPAGTSKPLAIADYSWSDDNSKLLVFTNTRKEIGRAHV